MVRIIITGLLATVAPLLAAADDFYTDWRDHDAILARLRTVAAAHPERVSEECIGTTHEGRDIVAFHLSAADRAAAPRLLIVGTQHAREWISPLACTYLVEHLLDNPDDDPAVAAMAQALDFTVVPIANPDGYLFSWADDDNRGWRKNRRDNGDGSYGVDLNRNWGYAWQAYDDPDWYTYPGPEAFSEPETRALRDLTLALDDLQAAIDVHTPHAYVIQPFASSSDPAPRYDEMEPLTTAITAAMNDRVDDDRWGYLADYGGYGASGASIDWWLGVADVICWGFELDRGNSTDDILPTSQEALAGLLVLGPAVAQMGTRSITLTASDGGTALTTTAHLLSRDLESAEATTHAFGYLAGDRDHAIDLGTVPAAIAATPHPPRPDTARVGF